MGGGGGGRGEWYLTSLFQVYGDVGRAVVHFFYDICGDMDRSPGWEVEHSDDPTVLMARMRLGINTNSTRDNTTPAEVSDNKTSPSHTLQATAALGKGGSQMTRSYESVSAA